MLVLTRKHNEQVIITTSHGERIEICVIEMGWEKVRLGIDAPLDMSVHRAEVQARIDAKREGNHAAE